MSVWSDVLIGLAFVAGGYWLIKTIYQWNRFRRSILFKLYMSF
ncbi:MAG: hypothetical protein ACLUUU_11650 [Mediterraneibacter faecis]